MTTPHCRNRLAARGTMMLVALFLMTIFAGARTPALAQTPPARPAASVPSAPAGFRPPAVPLVAVDPYFSIWSTYDRLTDGPTRHWTGRAHPLTGLIRIDGRARRVIGNLPVTVAPMEQRSVTVHPLRTVYELESDGVHLSLTFTNATLPNDLELVSRPVTYITWDVRATDGKAHDVSLYFDASAQLAVDDPHQTVTWERVSRPGLQMMRVGTQDQNVLGKVGDNRRIDWGYAYLAAPEQPGTTSSISADVASLEQFVTRGTLAAQDDVKKPRPADADSPVLSVAFALGKVQAAPVSRHVLLAYDDVWALEYFGERARAWWRRNGKDAETLLQESEADYARLKTAAETFDASLTRDLRANGGDAYARIATLAFRQTLAAHKLIAHPRTGAPLYFSKENFSNGCIGTVDVTYPSSPFFLLFNPALLEAQLRPILEYAGMERWKFPFAPHDLGTYPKANGQVYGGKEASEVNQMPVEESANMLLMLGALARLHGRTDLAREYWPTAKKWIAYLEEKGFDPENQLSTDDFSGHLAHNSNLSIKAILAIAAGGALARDLQQAQPQDAQEGERLTSLSRSLAQKWIAAAREGNHYTLAFDLRDSWSQKYNLVWDRLLDLQTFPAEVASTELAYYRTQLRPFGLPLDQRSAYTKADWIVWTATLASDRADFEALIDPLARFLQSTPDRVPFTDWYYTNTAQQRGFQARSVVGGVFIPMLRDRKMIATWSRTSTSR